MSEGFRVIVCKNGENSGINLSVSQDDSIASLLERAAKELKIIGGATRIFNIQGVELHDLAQITDGEFLFVSSGDDFIPMGANDIKDMILDMDDDFNELDDEEQKPVGFDELPEELKVPLLDSLEYGEKVIWVGRSIFLKPLTLNLLALIILLIFVLLLSGLTHAWRVIIFISVLAIFCGIFVLIYTISVAKQFYAVTTRRILIIHPGWKMGSRIWFRKIRKSPEFPQLASLQLEVEKEFGIGSVLFRSTRFGFVNLKVSDAYIAADAIRKRLPEAPPKTMVKF